jgi:membrane-bound lytic murein transglycosylase C
MNALAFWTTIGLALTSMGIATRDTQALMQAADGLAQAGIIGKKTETLKALPVAQAKTGQSTPTNAVQQSPIAQAETTEESIAQQFALLEANARQQWGEAQTALPSQDQVVKYSADMRSRSIIDLKEGKLIVESLVDANTDVVMHQVLTNALLTPDDPRQVNLLSTQPDGQTGKPFLEGQLVDSLGKPINTLARAQKFAAWAIVNRAQVFTTPAGKVKRIELPLDANHKQVRAARFAHYIETAAQEYKLDPNLLYAITETESHFNPFAISRTGALGLMQLVATKAGRDAVKATSGKDRIPSSDELKDPATNVRLGAAYLARLSTHYLGDVSDPVSNEYAVIAAYNGGSVRALQVFAQNKSQAIQAINALPPQLVYDSLRTRHASAETRSYVQKVTAAKHRYSNRV